jgi:serine/threonine protein kinase
LADDAQCLRCLLRLGQSAVPPGGDKPTTSRSDSPSRATASTPTAAELSEAFPQYEILNLIGRGGMGSVYRARQRSLDRMVAIKTIVEDDGDPAFAERFVREGRALARLSHPNIVTVHDFGVSNGMFFLVMEHIDGVNLRQAIDARAFDPADALRIVEQVCNALQYAHARGVVHRDIKPENILLTEDGTAKIADFGLAKLLDANRQQVTLTATRQIMGTVAYMAPEQIDNSAAVDHRADIYSLGVVFYELLTGHLPLGRFELPSQRVAGVDQRIDPVVMKTLSRSPGDRFQSASDLRVEVASIQSSPARAPVKAAAESVPYPAAATALPGRKMADDDPENLSQSISFKVEMHGGLAEGQGLMTFTPDEIRFEWKVADAILGVVTGELKTHRLRLNQIAKMQLTDYLVVAHLKIHGKSLAAMEPLPLKSMGNVVLSIGRSDRETVRNWIAYYEQTGQLHRSLPGGPPQRPFPNATAYGANGSGIWMYWVGLPLLVLMLMVPILIGSYFVLDTRTESGSPAVQIATIATSEGSFWNQPIVLIAGTNESESEASQLTLAADDVSDVESVRRNGERSVTFRLTIDGRNKVKRWNDTLRMADESQGWRLTSQGGIDILAAPSIDHSRLLGTDVSDDQWEKILSQTGRRTATRRTTVVSDSEDPVPDP